MIYELVSAEDFVSFPSDPEAKWLALESTCRKNMNELLTHSSEAAADDDLRLQYMNIVSAAAEELGIGALQVPAVPGNFDHFVMEATRVATKLRLRSSSSMTPTSVGLSRATQIRIIREIDRLRASLNDSNVSEEIKKKAMSKLSELEQLFLAPRSEFGKVFALISQLSVGLGGVTTTLALLPDAIATITWLVGEEKQQEEEATRLLIERSKPLQIEDQRSRPDLDDEIPF